MLSYSSAHFGNTGFWEFMIFIHMCSYNCSALETQCLQTQLWCTQSLSRSKYSCKQLVVSCQQGSIHANCLYRNKQHSGGSIASRILRIPVCCVQTLLVVEGIKWSTSPFSMKYCFRRCKSWGSSPYHDEGPHWLVSIHLICESTSHNKLYCMCLGGAMEVQ